MVASQRQQRPGRFVWLTGVAGVVVIMSLVIRERLTERSLQLVGYTEIFGGSARSLWVEAHDYIQGLYWAKRIAAKVAPRHLPDEERVARLASWVFDHFVGYEAAFPAQEDHFLNTARRGYGYCDQLSHVLATLYWSAGYPARLRMLLSADDISHHTVMEVFVKGQWVVVDPYFKTLFQDPQGRLLSVEGLAKFPGRLDMYRSRGATVQLADFQRGTIFTTVPYAPPDQLVNKVLRRLRRGRRAAPLGKPGAQPCPPACQAEPQPASEQGATSESLVPGGLGPVDPARWSEVIRLDRARWSELVGEDAAARAQYAQLADDPAVSRPVQCAATYWLGRSAWRAGDRARCSEALSLMDRGDVLPCEAPWQAAAAQLRTQCAPSQRQRVARRRPAWGKSASP